MKLHITLVCLGMLLLSLAVGQLLRHQAQAIEHHNYQPVDSPTFNMALDTCHKLGLSLHTVLSEPVCLTPHDNGACGEYATQSLIKCGDDRIKDLHDTTIIFITQAPD